MKLQITQKENIHPSTCMSIKLCGTGIHCGETVISWFPVLCSKKSYSQNNWKFPIWSLPVAGLKNSIRSTASATKRSLGPIIFLTSVRRRWKAGTSARRKFSWICFKNLQWPSRPCNYSYFAIVKLGS